jgi:predicted transcriptional regulator
MKNIKHIVKALLRNKYIAVSKRSNRKPYELTSIGQRYLKFKQPE